MESERQSGAAAHEPVEAGFVAMPRATAAPIVLAAGIVMLAAGFALGLVMSLVGAVLLFIGLGMWVANLASSRGHVHEPLAELSQRPQPVLGTTGRVERLVTGMPGYRVQLPQHVHPISAGVKGGLVGGMVMPVPALLYGVLSGHGIWYPVNLLAGMALPSIGTLSAAELDKFHASYVVAAVIIHVATSLTAGLAYGVLLPMLPDIPKPLAWGGLLMPVLWTAVSFLALVRSNSTLSKDLDWPSFIFSQFVFGLVAAIVVIRLHRMPPLAAGFLGGIVGGALMVIPAFLWAWISGNSVWYPANVLSSMLVAKVSEMTPEELQLFHSEWIGYAVMIHGTMSIVFGIVYGFLLPKLPRIPGPMAWGALLMPLVWTGASYSLMGVVNPALQRHVDWPWFVGSQFIFGVVASIVVVRSQQIAVPPVGRGLHAGQS